MLSIVHALPAELIDAIGPAPGIGRRSWQELVELMEKAPIAEAVVKFAADDDRQRLASEERFKAVASHLKPQREARGALGVLSSPAGARLAQFKQNKTKMEITIDKKATPEFAAFLINQVPALFDAHQAKHKLQNGE